MGSLNITIVKPIRLFKNILLVAKQPKPWYCAHGVSMRKKCNRFATTILLVSAVSTALAIQRDIRTTRELFPNTEDRGRAAIEYMDSQLQVVAAYYYSQRHHNSRWLLIETAITSADVMTIERDNIHLVHPDGREIPLASQRSFAQDHQRTRLLVQAATTTRHGIGTYIVRQRARRFQFFVSPFDGIADKLFDTDQHRVAWGDLFFSSPTGRWDSGTYSLVVTGGEGRQAVLPIDLD